MTSFAPQKHHFTRDQKRVLGATLVGTTVEWYDFFIYANAAALIFPICQHGMRPAALSKFTFDRARLRKIFL